MKPTPHRPQHGPVIALTQLITEYPELPPLQWHLTTSGQLGADRHRIVPNDGPADVRAVLAAYAAVLGADPTEPFLYMHDGRMIVSQHIRTTWRDVPLNIATYATLAEYPELAPAVAA
ncbi:hypothetical protein [Kitasatospora viridis]|uniref:Uncharacterized protein n=1 Tax=Kitasatospora viridis TaxID=281105 RepID=A0A561UKT8_9ACTN|nr:hypothetical protein [Kitasatospora viridis]TWF99956.1 hypothetical protein FHX73_113816 [Kitasatospora viridis]